ncbi:hypothetical protein [Rhodothalassium salexigens]|nr:hypothetical protein [Rhodothalassium salexigens]MBB4210776.1 hypothetical protein [Rhodothalassium salexigens DSM 2132]
MYWLFLALALHSAADAPPETAPTTPPPGRDTVGPVAEEAPSAAMEAAAAMGRLLGLARHCTLDADDIEDFLVAAEARINALSETRADRVMARIELENTASLSEARGARADCGAVAERLEERLRAQR